MPSEASLLAANEAFYHAFRSRDILAMDAAWGRENPISCIHPGWDALFGRHEVMRSWQAILANPDAPKILIEAAKAFVMEPCAFVVCREILEEAQMLATNVFVTEEGDWRLVHHQAGPATATHRTSDIPRSTMH